MVYQIYHLYSGVNDGYQVLMRKLMPDGKLTKCQHHSDKKMFQGLPGSRAGTGTLSISEDPATRAQTVALSGKGSVSTSGPHPANPPPAN